MWNWLGISKIEPKKSKKYIWRQKMIIHKSAPTVRLFYFYNLEMKRMNTSQDALGCHDGPHDSLRPNELSMKLQNLILRCPGNWYLEPPVNCQPSHWRKDPINLKKTNEIDNNGFQNFRILSFSKNVKFYIFHISDLRKRSNDIRNITKYNILSIMKSFNLIFEILKIFKKLQKMKFSESRTGHLFYFI